MLSAASNEARFANLAFLILSRDTPFEHVQFLSDRSGYDLRALELIPPSRNVSHGTGVDFHWSGQIDITTRLGFNVGAIGLRASVQPAVKN